MPDVNEPQDLRYDCALPAAVLILNTIDGKDATKAELLACVTFIVLEALNEYSRRRSPAFAHSDN